MSTMQSRDVLSNMPTITQHTGLIIKEPWDPSVWTYCFWLLVVYTETDTPWACSFLRLGSRDLRCNAIPLNPNPASEISSLYKWVLILGYWKDQYNHSATFRPQDKQGASTAVVALYITNDHAKWCVYYSACDKAISWVFALPVMITHPHLLRCST